MLAKRRVSETVYSQSTYGYAKILFFSRITSPVLSRQVTSVPIN